MEHFDIISCFITKELLDKCYENLDIDEKAEPEYVEIGDLLDYAYQSKNQITLIVNEDNYLSHKIMSYDSAQNYYQSERARIWSGPKTGKRVQVSKSPYKDGLVRSEDCSSSNLDEWNEHKYNVAFKCNWLKFIQNKDLTDELLRTGNRPIVSRSGDKWSEDNTKILSVIREDLRRRAK